MACTFVGVKGDFWKKKSPIRLPKAHASFKAKSYYPYTLLPTGDDLIPGSASAPPPPGRPPPHASNP